MICKNRGFSVKEGTEFCQENIQSDGMASLDELLKKTEPGALEGTYKSTSKTNELPKNLKGELQPVRKNVSGKKVKWHVIFIILLCVAFVCGSGYYVISKFFQTNEEQTAQSENDRFDEKTEKESAEESSVDDVDTAYMKTVEEDDIIYTDGTLYVKNQLLLTAEDGYSYKDLETLVSGYGGEIVGYIPVAEEYQVELTTDSDFDVETLVDTFNASEQVQYASLNYVFYEETDSVDYEKDSWTYNGSGDTDWSITQPGGNNWWAEMTMLPLVWGSDNVTFSDVSVGIIDSCFNTGQKDLSGLFKQTWNNDTSHFYDDKGNEDDDVRNHGTHVAGLIAAKGGNGYGITGTASCMDVSLYGYSMYGSGGGKKFFSMMEYKYAMSLMLKNNVKVINISMGFSTEVMVACSQKNTDVLNQIEEIQTSMEKFLLRYHNKGYEFLICKAAGNDSGQYWVTCEVSEEHPYGVKKSNKGGKGAFITDVSSDYDFLGGIKNEAVRQHIMVVGAGAFSQDSLDYGGTGMKKAYYSNSDCDIYAPGGDAYNKILSLGYDQATLELCGTSMATPIVSGVAALVWGINPNLTSAEVKEILIESGNENFYKNLNRDSLGSKIGQIIYDDSNDIHYINAAIAVVNAYEKTGDQTTNETAITDCMFLVETYDKATDNDGNASYDLVDADVLLYDENNTLIMQLDADEKGIYSSFVTPGKYHLVVKSDRFVTYEETITLSDTVVYKEIVMERCQLKGIVSDENQEKVQNGTAEIYSGDELIASFVLDSEGSFTYECEQGTYTLVVKAEGYEEYTEEITVGAESEFDCFVILKRGEFEVMDYWNDVAALADALNMKYSSDVSDIYCSDGSVEISYSKGEYIRESIHNMGNENLTLFDIKLGENEESVIKKIEEHGSAFVKSFLYQNQRYMHVMMVSYNDISVYMNLIFDTDQNIAAWELSTPGTRENEEDFYEILRLNNQRKEVSDIDWRQAYFDYIFDNLCNDLDVDTLQSYSKASYALCYIDDDDIPELLVHTTYDDSTYELNSLEKYVDGELVDVYLDGTVGSYHEKQNIMLIESAWSSGMCYDWICELDETEITILYGGKKGLDDSGQYIYEWDGESLSDNNSYEEALNAYFYREESQTPKYASTLEILQQLVD